MTYRKIVLEPMGEPAMSMAMSELEQDIRDIRKDISTILREMVTRPELIAALADKADRKEVAQLRTQLDEQPKVSRERWNLSVNGCILAVMVAGGGTGFLGMLAAIAAVVVAILKP